MDFYLWCEEENKRTYAERAKAEFEKQKKK
jgi:hypothetical protein